MNTLRMAKFLKRQGKPMTLVELLRIWKTVDYLRFVEEPKATKRQRAKEAQV